MNTKNTSFSEVVLLGRVHSVTICYSRVVKSTLKSTQIMHDPTHMCMCCLVKYPHISRIAEIWSPKYWVPRNQVILRAHECAIFLVCYCQRTSERKRERQRARSVAEAPSSCHKHFKCMAYTHNTLATFREYNVSSCVCLPESTCVPRLGGRQTEQTYTQTHRGTPLRINGTSGTLRNYTNMCTTQRRILHGIYIDGDFFACVRTQNPHIHPCPVIYHTGILTNTSHFFLLV